MKETTLQAKQVTTTKVIFRKWNSGEVIALFPEVPHDVHGIYCSSYQHTGQHGAASPDSVTLMTTLATPSEYNDLFMELQRIGYKLDVRSRISRNAYQVRKEASKL